MDAPRNVTDCSNRTILFSFDPTAAWPKEITQGPALEWPRVISDDFHAFRMTSRAMAVLYIVGVGAVGIVLVVKAVSMAVPKAQYGLVEFGFLVVCCRFSFFRVQLQSRASMPVACCWLPESCFEFFIVPLQRGPTTITRDNVKY